MINYKIYKNCLNTDSSRKIFKFVLKTCNFYCPTLFKKKDVYKKTWLDKKFIDKMTLFRKKYKKRFSAMYDSVQISNEFQKILFNNNLDLIAEKFLKIKRDNLLVRGMQLRMDFPNDTRNSYSWHQDNAYDRYNLYSKNGVVLWLPLVDTNKQNGTLLIKPGSQNSSYNCSARVDKGDRYNSEQILVKKKYLRKYKTESVDVKKNSALATYCGIFHKSGENLSNHIRFTIIVRYNNQFSKDFSLFRNL